MLFVVFSYLFKCEKLTVRSWFLRLGCVWLDVAAYEALCKALQVGHHLGSSQQITLDLGMLQAGALRM